jgi:RNA polymerase sigma factor (sigma-70 family)
MQSVWNSSAAFGHEAVMEPSDADLWERSRAGDPDAFGMLFDRHAKVIYNYCFRRIGNWVTAEDLLSVVFLEAWRRRDKKLPPDKVLPWLFGIATNVIRNQRRSERRHLAALSRVPPARGEPDFGEDTDRQLDDRQKAEEALTALRSLPPRQQDAFFLCGVMELSYEDAALALNVPVGTVRSRLSRARDRLKELDCDFGHEQEENPTYQEARQA